MKIVYYADDGKEFNNRDDCEEYERQQNYEKADGIIAGFCNAERIPYSDDDFTDKITILYLADQTAVEIFKDRCYKEDTYFQGIDKPGIYFWNNGDWEGPQGEWVLIDDIISVYEEKLKELENYREMAKGD